MSSFAKAAIVAAFVVLGPTVSFAEWPNCTKIGETTCNGGMFYRCQQLSQGLGFIATGQTCQQAACRDRQRALRAKFAAWNGKCQGASSTRQAALYTQCIAERADLHNENADLLK